MNRQIKQPLKIVDDFLEVPFLWRHYALQQSYQKDQSGHPGSKSPTLDELNDSLFHQLAGKIILHCCGKTGFERLKLNFTSITLADKCDIVPHQDEPFYNIAGLIYLNPISPKNTGTAFYTKRDVDFIPNLIVENIFNRMIIFKPDMWHSPLDFFGTDLESSRLTITFFGIAV